MARHPVRTVLTKGILCGLLLCGGLAFSEKALSAIPTGPALSATAPAAPAKGPGFVQKRLGGGFNKAKKMFNSGKKSLNKKAQKIKQYLKEGSTARSAEKKPKSSPGTSDQKGDPAVKSPPAAGQGENNSPPPPPPAGNPPINPANSAGSEFDPRSGTGQSADKPFRS